MMDDLICCSEAKQFKSKRIDHEAKFKRFLEWARPCTGSPVIVSGVQPDLTSTTYVIQLVRQINYGPIEFKRYFVFVSSDNEPFKEVSQEDLVEANFKKLNSFKNLVCSSHNKFSELNVYEKDPVNQHHWRADVARPASGIDL